MSAIARPETAGVWYRPSIADLLFLPTLLDLLSIFRLEPERRVLLTHR